MEEQKTGKGFIVFLVLFVLCLFVFLFVRNVYFSNIHTNLNYVSIGSGYINIDIPIEIGSDVIDVDSGYVNVDIDANYVDVDGGEFTWQDITICNGIDSCITLMDRNLGATTNDISKTGSYGYYFQWGNNYGFNSHSLNGKVGQVDAGQYGPNNPYNSGNFLYGYTNRDSVGNGNLRGGIGDSENNHRGWDNRYDTAQDRQGPCPSGYHVPSIGERNQLLYYWYNSLDTKYGILSNNYSLYGLTDQEGKIGKMIIEYFYIPTAGNIITNRVQYNGTGDMIPYLVGLTSAGMMAEVRSSTPFGGGSHGFRPFSVVLYEYTDSISAGISGIGGSQGLPIRCFKNPDSDN